MTFARMLKNLNNLLLKLVDESQEVKRRLFTFNLSIRKNPRPTNQWSLNTSFEPNISNQISPEKEPNLTIID